MKMILTCNAFKFEDKMYTQKSGTSIGAKPAGAYAEIFMVRVEKEGQQRWRGKRERVVKYCKIFILIKLVRSSHTQNTSSFP